MLITSNENSYFLSHQEPICIVQTKNETNIKIRSTVLDQEKINLILGKIKDVTDKISNDKNFLIIISGSNLVINNISIISTLELMFYDILKNHDNLSIKLKLTFSKKHYSRVFIEYSLLGKYINRTLDNEFISEMEKIGSKIYQVKRNNRLNNIECGGYRNLVSYENYLKNGDNISQITTEILTTLNFFEISDDDKPTIAEYISELVGNALEHAKSDCLIHIVFHNNLVKNDKTKHKRDKPKRHGIFISVANISSTLIYSNAKSYILSHMNQLDNKKEITKYYNKHNLLFNKKIYTRMVLYVCSFSSKSKH